MKKWNSSCTAFLVMGGLFFLWQSAVWLGVESSRALADFAGGGQVAYTLAGLVGLLAGGLLVDKWAQPRARRQRLAAILAGAAAVFTVVLRFAPNLPVLALLLAVACLCGFAVLGVLLYDIFRHIPYGMKPVVMGLAMALGVLLRLPADYSRAFGWNADWVYSISAAVGMAALAVLLPLWRPRVQQVFAELRPATKKRWLGLLAFGGVCAVLLVLLAVIFEASLAEVYFTNAQAFGLNVAQLLAPLLAGLMSIRLGRNTTMFLGVFALGFGIVSYFFPHRGALGLVFSIAAVVGLNLFLVPMVTLFADVAQYARSPGVVGVLGFAFSMLMRLVGIPLAGLVRLMGEDVTFIIYLVLYFVALPLTAVLFVHLQRFKEENEGEADDDLPAPAQAAGAGVDLGRFGFTASEEELLPYALGPMAAAEIAVALRMTPEACAALTSELLAKTAAATRIELRVLLLGDAVAFEDDAADAPAPGGNQ